MIISHHSSHLLWFLMYVSAAFLKLMVLMVSPLSLSIILILIREFNVAVDMQFLMSVLMLFILKLQKSGRVFL